MVIIHIRGGLGNQMFQYALYHFFKKNGVRSYIDLSHYRHRHQKTTYQPDKLFNAQADTISLPTKIFVKFIWKILYRFFTNEYIESHNKFGTFDKSIHQLTFAYLKGYWQSEKYFVETKSELLNVFKFPSVCDTKNIEILDKINMMTSVSIHIRRGDYLDAGIGWTLGLQYYRNAIQYIKDNIAQPVFFVFSDDPEWTAKNLSLSNVFFIDWNIEANSYIDMQLMSECKHNIIANSTFSWWAAWLNKNEEKIVLAPQKWLPDIEGTRDIIPDEWIKIPVE